MFDMPFFQDDILNNIINFNKFYFTSRLWWGWIIVVFVFLGGAFILLRNTLRNPQYYQSFYQDSSFFFQNSRSEKIAFAVLLTAFIITGIRMFSLENSLFENFDLMAINTTQIMKYGLQSAFNYYRISPLAFWYLNFLYAITQNFILIKTFVLCDLALMIYLLYRLFDFIPVTKRLCFLALFLLTPTMLETSNIIFIERSLFIYLALSLICAKKYCSTGKLKWAVGYLFFANFAIYTKETSILFYFGILSFSIFYNIWNGVIILKSFIHPFKTIKSMPLEFLTGLSLFFYAALYFLLISLTENYKSDNSASVLELILYYKFELCVCLIVGIFFLKNSDIFKNDKNPLFSMQSYYVGGIFVLICIIFFLKLSPISPHLNGRTYYLVIPLLFSLGYMAYKIRNHCILILITLLISGYSVRQDITSYQQEQGKYYREIAEFFAENLDKNASETIFLEEKPFSKKPTQNVWMIEVWSSAFKYYFKDYNINFKFYTDYIKLLGNEHSSYSHLQGALYFNVYAWIYPNPGDWLVINRSIHEQKLEHFADYRKEKPQFQNKLFEVYKVK
ncbi:MAG: glycosyltransferase family 39 protein [Alphaproteobacteria bacterium]|nr:glycosyltransferase family 39 protein [Alphaproteobacteria bacterium]